MTKELTAEQKQMLAGGVDKRRTVIQVGMLPLIQLLNAAANGESVALKVTGLPEKAKVISATLNELAGFVGFVVQHDTFEWVAEMAYPPIIKATVEVVKVEPVKSVDDDKSKGKSGTTAGKEGGKP